MSSVPTGSARSTTSASDEVSWKRQHNYLTLVADHRAGKIVWGSDGAGERAADRFFAELDPGSPRTAPPPPPEDTPAASPAPSPAPFQERVDDSRSARERWPKHDPK